jgi:hypothetical protein
MLSCCIQLICIFLLSLCCHQMPDLPKKAISGAKKNKIQKHFPLSISNFNIQWIKITE